jgi:hypothetical protein
VGRGARLTISQMVSLSRISHNKAPQAFLRALLVPDPRRYQGLFPQLGLGVGLHCVPTDPPLFAATPPASATGPCTHTACPRLKICSFSPPASREALRETRPAKPLPTRKTCVYPPPLPRTTRQTNLNPNSCPRLPNNCSS